MTKTIGILYGTENTFPLALIERINRKKIKGVKAESVLIDQVSEAGKTGYSVLIDRISDNIPFYQSYLKSTAVSGTSIINNPLLASINDHFLAISIIKQAGIPVPKTVLLPSKERPEGTSENSFRNLAFPMAWESMFEYIGFPAYLKPIAGSTEGSVYEVQNVSDLWNKHERTGQRVMILQEKIQFHDYFRCYCVGQKDVHIMPFEPNNPPHLRYATQVKMTGEEQEKVLPLIRDYTLLINQTLGYDFSAIEFGIRNGLPVAINLSDISPDADLYSIGPDNFEWLVEAVANFAIQKALQHEEGKTNLTWGTTLLAAVTNSETTKATTGALAKTGKATAKIKPLNKDN